MSDSLVTRLRALACNSYRFTQDEPEGLALLEAADALERKIKEHGETWANGQAHIDALKAKLAEAEREIGIIKPDRQAWYETALRFSNEVIEARAEAAAYRHMLKIALGCIDFDENRATVKEICEALSQPGPGAALLERVKKLEAVVNAGKRLWVDQNNVHAWEALYQGLAALEEKP